MNVMPRPISDSQSRQLLYELNRLLISDQERFLSRLDEENQARENVHKQALAAAAEQHERVRRSVEAERQRLETQIQAERERREAEIRIEIERQRREKAEREIEEKRREIERTKAIEAEKRRFAEIERQEREAKEVAKAQQERQKQEAAQKALENRKVEQQKANIARKQTEATTPAPRLSNPSTTPAKTPPSTNSASQPPSSLPSSGLSTVTRDRRSEEEHERYLEIHKRLKEMRKFMVAESKKEKALKDTMGDMRREMRKSVGQLTEGKGANKQSLANILTILKKSLTLRCPSTPVPPLLADLPSSAPPNGEGPALLIYLLNIFAKAIISQWIDEAGVSPKAADPVGIIASHIFAHPDFRWHDTSLISILLAKLHKTCPILFGICGPENTEQGKRRIGWLRDENGWLSRQRHYERMTGLASGFAALSLRNYEKSKYNNPYPDYHYWTALARIANTPTQELTQTHFVVLKGMVENYVGKFIGFYGNAAVAALRLVLLELPKRLPEDQRQGVAVKGVQALVEVLKRDSKLVL